MLSAQGKLRRLHLGTLAAGSLLFLGGCDPSIRATVEDGIINIANSLLSALLQALLQVGAQAAQGTA